MIEPVTVDPGGYPLLAAGDSDSVFRSQTLTGLFRDRRKEEKSKKRSKTPPKSYSSARRSRSISRSVDAFTTLSVWKGRWSII